MLALTAAGLAVAAVFVVAAARAAAGGGVESLTHTCSATDRQFIKQAAENMAAVGLLGRDYLAGDASAKDVVAATDNAARFVGRTRPTDPTLARARLLVGAMFTEYRDAIRARERRRDAGPHMVRAYGLANFAHELLAEARPALAERGCDVAGLL